MAVEVYRLTPQERAVNQFNRLMEFQVAFAQLTSNNVIRRLLEDEKGKQQFEATHTLLTYSTFRFFTDILEYGTEGMKEDAHKKSENLTKYLEGKLKLEALGIDRGIISKREEELIDFIQCQMGLDYQRDWVDPFTKPPLK
ncbi:hypothetical protein HY439_03460 [Candidatus Microgenomates bacterium]|nr:hypothetical protein [Candidatus Microgenomates bacterium]